MATSTATVRSTDLVIADLAEENVRLWEDVNSLKAELEMVKAENHALKSESVTRREMVSVAVDQLAVVTTRERNRVRARQVSYTPTPRLDPMDLRCASCGSTNIAGASPQLTQEESGAIDCSICGHTSMPAAAPAGAAGKVA